jgi:four helix bundle protein
VNNVIQQKSYDFAIRIVKTSKYLHESKREYILSRQLLKSGVAIGAMIEESIGAQTHKDFYAKLTIAYKEARETKFWLRLLDDTSYLDKTEAESLLENCEEILRIIGSIQKTLKLKLNLNPNP